MKLDQLKELAARTLGVGKKRIKVLDEDRALEAITREDVRDLIKEGAIVIKKKKGVSRARARELIKKRKKGKRRGYGSRRGSKKARSGDKTTWILKVRAQRRRLKLLRPSIPKLYRRAYRMVKAGYFKSVKHLESHLKRGKV